MKKSIRLLVVVAFGAIATFSCKEKEPTPEPTPTLRFSYSVDGMQAAFTAMINYGNAFQWDFGDGTTSTEKNPVHVYAEGGTYDVTLSVTGRGETKSFTKEVSLALSNLQMLAGDNRFPNGKKWKISASHSSTDRFAVADANFTNVQALSAGILGSAVGLPEVYEDVFLFKNDGTYQHLPKTGNGAFAGLVYTMVSGIQILNATPTSQEFGLCYGAYTPQAGATFTFVEKEDYPIMTAYGNTTYQNVMTIDFSGTEFIGFMDFTRKCIVRSLTPTSMQLVLFVCAAPQAAPYPTHAILLTFEVVS